MATSGEKQFEPMGDRIIRLALRRMRKLVAGESLPAETINDARESLNAMIMEWQGTGPRIWQREQVLVFIEPGRRRYDLPSSLVVMERDLISRSLNADAAESDTTIEVADVTGISDGMTALVISSPTSATLTTVSGDPAGTTVTLSDPLSADSEAGSAVLFYSPIVSKPLRLEYAMHQNRNGDEVWVNIDTREEYLRQTYKDSPGRPVRLYYNSARGTGELYAWPTGEFWGDRLNLDMMIPFDLFVTPSDSPDFPQEWVNALSWALASELGPEFGVPPNRQQVLDARASTSVQVMMSFDRNPATITFERDRSDEMSDSGSMPGFD